MDSSDTVRIDPADSAEDVDAFIRFAWEIYVDDPLWVPPVISHQREFLDKNRGAFFEVGEAQYFLARQGGRIVGRISAHVNHAYEKFHDNETGFFGFFECVNDTAVSRALFDAAADWVRARGKSKLHGPLSFGIYDEVGLLVDGFDIMPAMMHTHNPRYYEDLVLDYGFAKAFDWYAYKGVKEKMLPDLPKLKEMLDNLCQKNNIVVAPVKRRDFATRGAQVCEMFNEIWSKNWGHVPLTKAQFEGFFTQLAPIIPYGMSNILLDQGEMVGFIITMPDINPIIKKFNGSFSLLNKLRLLWFARVHRPKRHRVLIMGIKRSHQWKRLHHILIAHTILTALIKFKSEFTDCSLIPESLINWNKTLKSYNLDIYKTFRLYDRVL